MAKRGRVPPPMLSRPKLQKGDYEYLSAWQTLDEGRPSGMAGPSAISIAEIESYCNLVGINTKAERLRYLRLLRRLDRVYLEHWAEKRAAQK